MAKENTIKPIFKSEELEQNHRLPFSLAKGQGQTVARRQSPPSASPRRVSRFSPAQARLGRSNSSQLARRGWAGMLHSWESRIEVFAPVAKETKPICVALWLVFYISLFLWLCFYMPSYIQADTERKECNLYWYLLLRWLSIADTFFVLKIRWQLFKMPSTWHSRKLALKELVQDGNLLIF